MAHAASTSAINLATGWSSGVPDWPVLTVPRGAYCRWGDGVSRRDPHGDPRSLVLDRAMLREAGIERVVFSGGEPLLHPDLLHVIASYASLGVASIVVITNGLLASRERLLAIQGAGATGVTFSLDSIDPAIACQTRRLEVGQLARVLDHLSVAGAMRSAAWEASVNSKRPTAATAARGVRA